MNALKASVFCDLTRPMSFRTTKGFEERNVTSVRSFGKSTYFRGDYGIWCVVTPPCPVLSASVNRFRDGEHVLNIQCPQDWADGVIRQLKEAVRLARPQQADFEAYWKQCHLPNFQALEIRTKYTTKRSKTFDYVNIYNDATELTGTCDICAGSVVQCSLSFELVEYEQDDGVYTGIGCNFGAGIRVVRLGGVPDAIKRPWDWSGVDFDTLSSPMYDHLRVKTGAMGVMDVRGRVAVVEPKPAFKDAMRDFHARAGADAWDDTITMPKSIEPGCVAVATVVPSRNNTRITWTASALSTARRQKRRKLHGVSATAEAKTDGDNTGSSAGSQTSGRYT